MTDAAPAPDLPTRLERVWDGFAAPSLASCAGALLVAFLELALSCVFFTPPRLATLSPGVLMQADGDEYCALSLRLLRYRRAGVHGLQVAYLGASTATRSLLDHDPAVLSRLVSARLRRRVRMNLWSANGQRYEDALVILDQLPEDFVGALVLVINDYKDDERAILPGRAGDRFVERILAENTTSRDELWRSEGYVPRRTGVFFLDHLDFFAARRAAALRFGQPPRGGRPAEDPTLDPDRLRKMREQMRLAQVEAHRRNHVAAADARPSREPPILGKNRQIIDKLVDKSTERGIITVFVEAPLNPLRAPYYSHRLAQYYADMARYAAERGALYWNWNGELDLSPQDFGDAIHLASTSGRAQYQKLLTDNLVEALSRRFGAGGPGSHLKDEDEDG